MDNPQNWIIGSLLHTHFAGIKTIEIVGKLMGLKNM
jgi:hypothetical protein